jgi:Ca2+-binding EF-hand superfamily protein
MDFTSKRKGERRDKKGGDDDDMGRSRPKGSSGRDNSLQLIPRPAQDDIADSVNAFLHTSDESCVGKVFQEQLEESKAPKLSRKQFRKALAALGAQLSDADEGIIFESLDFRGEGSVFIEDILLYCMDLAYNGDSLDAALVCRQTLEKKKVPLKDLQRGLTRLDSKRSGQVNHKSFEKVFIKLCGGEGLVTSDQLADLERFVDPQKDGKVDINYLLAIATVSSDIPRAESKLKNCLKVMRVRGNSYRKELQREGGNSPIIAYLVLSDDNDGCDFSDFF